MSREAHVRFCESVGVRFPRGTRPMAETVIGLYKTEVIRRRGPLAEP